MTDLAEQARLAYAAGWALSGGPMTARVQAGGAAVVAASLNTRDPVILEVALQIGKLEGTWATYFQRRERLIAAQTALVLKTWHQITASLHPRQTIRRVSAELGPKPDPVQAREIAAVAAAGLLSGVYAHDSHHQLQQIVQDALRAAAAEGQAGSLAIAADRLGRAFSFTRTFRILYGQLGTLPELPLLAQQWIQRMIAGAASSTGSLIARMITAGSTETEVEAAVTSALGTGLDAAAGRAVKLFLDQAMTQAMSQASIQLYQAEGVSQVYFLTAGDAAVCVMCQEAADGNPYTTQDVPTPGLHPDCRCTVTPADPEPYQALAAYLP